MPWNRSQRYFFTALVGMGVLFAIGGYLVSIDLVPIDGALRPVLFWAYLAVSVVGAISMLYRWRNSRSNPTESRTYFWAAVSVALNTVIVALLVTGKLVLALIGSTVGAVLLVIESRTTPKVSA